jgi:type I restriction enzyme, S subunit
LSEKTVTFDKTILRNTSYPWKIVSLKDVCTKINDGVHKTPRYTEVGIPFISVNNMSRGKLNFADSKFISYAEHKELIKRCLPQRGDILLSKVGTLGVADIVDVDFEFSIFVQLALLKPNRDKILPQYLKYILNSSELQKAIQNSASGTTLKYIGINKISNLTIPLPPLFEQQHLSFLR